MGNNKNPYETHESYGVISIGRTHYSRPQALFGSSVKASNVIRLTIKEGGVAREYNQDRIIPDAPIIEIEMSNAQYAELLTSSDTQGVPCTLVYRADKGGLVNPCNFVSQKELFEAEFSIQQEESREYFNKTEEKLREMLNKKTLTKADRESLVRDISVLKDKLFANQESTCRQFNEMMEKTVTQAKAEIEAFMQAKLMSAGAVTMTGEFPVSIEEEQK